MNNRKIYLLLWIVCSARSQTIHHHLLSLKKNSLLVAEKLFNPLRAGESNPYSTDSLNQAKIDSFFGDKGLKLDPLIVRYIKNFYFYCEYVVRLEYGAKILGLALQQGIDALSIIRKKSWSSLIDTLIKTSQAKDWNGLQRLFLRSTPDWKTLHASVNVSSWQQLPSTDFWKSIIINQKNIEESETWQLLSCYMATTIFLQDSDHVAAIKHIQQTMLTYLPQLETALYDTNYNHLYASNELLHLTLLINKSRRAFWYTYTKKEWNPLSIEQQSNDFTKTLFYQLALLKPSQKPPQLPAALMGQLQSNPYVLEQLILLGMLKNLQALLQNLIDTDHLSNTMQHLKKNTISPTPSIIEYRTENYVLYQRINDIQQSLGSTQVKSSTTMTPQFSVGDLTGPLITGLKRVGSSIQDVSEHTLQAIENKGKSFAQTLKDTGLSGAHFMLSLDKKVANKLIKESNIIHDKMLEDLKKAKHAAINGVESAMQHSIEGINIAKKAAQHAAQWAGGIITKGCNLVRKGGTAVAQSVVDSSLSLNDEELCQAAGKSFESISDLAINALAAQSSELVVVVGGAVRLSVDAALNIAIIASDVVTAHLGDLPADALNGIKSMARDAAATVLQSLTIQAQYFMEQLITIFKFVSYFISMCVRMLIDNITAVVYLSTWLAHEVGAPDEREIASKISNVLGDHETTISAVITTVLLVSTIPLTGGIDTPLVAIALAATVGPQLFSIYGNYQQDSATIEQKHDEEVFTQRYESYVENNQSIYQHQQQTYAQELKEKYATQISNQQRQLVFSKEQSHQTYKALEEQISLLLGSYWAKLLDAQVVAQADLGAVMGYTTGVLDLNPSQGFSLYNDARLSFSQEIAAHPALFSLNKNDPLIAKNWFNQMHVIPLNVSRNTAHVRLRALYNLNNFYIGIGLLSELPLKEVQHTLRAPIDMYNQAKMIVITNSFSDQPSLRVYEHQAKGWSSALTMPEWNPGEWYHIKVELNEQRLKLKVWKEITFNTSDDEPEEWQSVSVSPIKLKTIGIISCASALEYQLKEPLLSIKNIPALRSATTYCALPCTDPTIKMSLSKEIDREIQSYNQAQFLRNPQQISPFFDLRICNEDELIKHNYLYRSKSSAIGSDYCILCQWNNDSQGNYTLIQDTLGQSPAQPLQGQRTMISLVSNNVYDCKTGKQLPRYYTDLATAYFKQYPTVSKRVRTAIRSARQNYLNSLMKVTINSKITLSAFSSKEIDNNHFIYIADKNNTDDIVLFCLINNNQITDYGIDPTYALHHPTDQAALCSLKTGRVLSLQTLETIPSFLNLDTQALLKDYQKSYGNLDKSSLSTIMSAQHNTSSQASAPPLKRSLAQQSIAISPHRPSSELVSPPAPPPAALQSLQNINQYSADDTGF